MNLVIVESPTKAKTINRYLGSEFTVISSGGHIIDLPTSELGVDIENNFQPTYTVLASRKKIVQELVSAAKKASLIYLACDPDREGEAIAWHIRSILPPKTQSYRITFQEITKSAILDAIKHQRDIDQNLVDAQQARRVLDRLVGYKVSPLLWRSVRTGLSAGRVQSIALRLICEREAAIRSFLAQEFWTVEGCFSSDTGNDISVELVKVGDKRVGRPPAWDELEKKRPASEIVLNSTLALKAPHDMWEIPAIIKEIEVKDKKNNAPPPFITSTLQQAASTWLGMSNSRTMAIAQQLYEGIEVGGEGSVGLITYMRTDSRRVAPEAIGAVRKQIEERFGEEYVPPKPNFYSNKSNAQDAHEAIRPTNLAYTPERMKAQLSAEQYKLYRMIYYRFLSSQMVPAIVESTRVEIAVGEEYGLRANGYRVKFPGYYAAYWLESDSKREKENELPKLSVGMELSKKFLISQQRFTQAPPRYNEASLVKLLEESGIGRPSTYATITKTIVDRGYVLRENRTFSPTEMGELVNRLLVEAFPDIITVPFTASMEEELDEIEAGKLNWTDSIRSFYERFSKDLEEAPDRIFATKKQTEELTDIICAKCGAPLQIKWAKGERFLGCSRYPECTNTKAFHIENGRIVVDEPVVSDVLCPNCGKPMIERSGRFGRFLACSDYPNCKTTLPIGSKVTDTPCPRPGCTGKLVERVSRGRTYYTCTNGSECDLIAPALPLAEKCPKCGYELTAPTGRKQSPIACFNPECELYRKRRTTAKSKTGGKRASKTSGKTSGRTTTRKTTTTKKTRKPRKTTKPRTKKTDS